jgi:hypothetical protein
MKYPLTAAVFFLSVWVLAALPAWAEDLPTPEQKGNEQMDESLAPGRKPAGLGDETLGPGQKWIEQIDGGFVFPVSPSVAAAYNRGVGGDILVGYRFNRDFSLAADVGYYACPENAGGAIAGEWDYTPLLAVARFNFGAGTVRPYVLLGGGIAFNNYSYTPFDSGKQMIQESNFLLTPGLGVLFVVAGNFALYVQGRLDMDFTPVAVPGGLFSESPVLFIPVKVGASFFVL